MVSTDRYMHNFSSPPGRFRQPRPAHVGTRVSRASIFCQGRPSCRREIRAWAGQEPEELETLMRQDIERLQSRQNQAQRRVEEQNGFSIEQPNRESSGAKDVLDKVLIADFFFVCLALAWLAAGVAEKGALSSSKLLDAWFPLWNAVFQPAIGILMLGALVSGALGWLNRDKQ